MWLSALSCWKWHRLCCNWTGDQKMVWLIHLITQISMFHAYICVRKTAQSARLYSLQVLEPFKNAVVDILKVRRRCVSTRLTAINMTNFKNLLRHWTSCNSWFMFMLPERWFSFKEGTDLITVVKILLSLSFSRLIQLIILPKYSADVTTYKPLPTAEFFS